MAQLIEPVVEAKGVLSEFKKNSLHAESATLVASSKDSMAKGKKQEKCLQHQ